MKMSIKNKRRKVKLKTIIFNQCSQKERKKKALIKQSKKNNNQNKISKTNNSDETK